MTDRDALFGRIHAAVFGLAVGGVACTASSGEVGSSSAATSTAAVGNSATDASRNSTSVRGAAGDVKCISAARAIAVGRADRDGSCPTSLDRSKTSSANWPSEIVLKYPEDPVLDAGWTERTRETQADVCCYSFTGLKDIPGVGRLLLSDGAPLQARPRSGSSWSRTVELERELDANARRTIGEAWLRDALLEHASVAAFARTTLELMAVGAPPDLVAATMAAGLEEVEHARLCFSLASAYLGRALEPGPLPSPSPRTPTLVEIAVAALEEGCVGESAGVLIASRAREGASVEAVRAVLDVIIADETRHAELSFRVLAWALRVGDEAVHRAVAAALERIAPAAVEEVSEDAIAAAHGRLGAAESRRLTNEAINTIVRPIIAQLLNPSVVMLG